MQLIEALKGLSEAERVGIVRHGNDFVVTRLTLCYPSEHSHKSARIPVRDFNEEMLVKALQKLGEIEGEFTPGNRRPDDLEKRAAAGDESAGDGRPAARQDVAS